MTDDAAPFLVAAGQVAGHIDNREQRYVERVAEPDEPRGFIRGVHVEASGQHRGLIGDDAHGMPVKAGEADNHVLRIILMGLNDPAVIDQRPDNLLHVIAFLWIVGDHGI